VSAAERLAGHVARCSRPHDRDLVATEYTLAYAHGSLKANDAAAALAALDALYAWREEQDR
jgi:hypothetical protein